MKQIVLLILYFGSMCLHAEVPAPFVDLNTTHARLTKDLARSDTREDIDVFVLCMLQCVLDKAKYPIKHDEILGRAKQVTEVTGWHISATKKVKKLFYDLPLFSSSTERHRLMFLVASGERPGEMIISEAKIAVVLKSGYYIKEDISE